MKEVKPTQKPVPSSDIKDLFFNSGLLDIWATSLEHKYIDRFGNCHLTAAGMEWIFNELVTKFKIESEQALLAAGYAPTGTFQEGAEVVSRNGTVLWKLPGGDGDHYRWDGELPKQVPVGSTPESTGGIGKGAWVSVGDASFRSDVKNGDGSLIGVGNGETLKERLDKLHTNVTPEMFILAPEVTHNRAFEEMFSYAKEKGVKVEGVGQYTLEATESGINITVDTDLSKASILCKTKENTGQWQQRTRIFAANQDYSDVSAQFSSVSITKNAQAFPVEGLSGHITIKSNDVVMNRIDGASTEPQLKAETNQIFPSGKLKYIQYYSFGNEKQVLYKPHLGSMDIKLGAILLDGAFIRSVITCKRNNVTLEISKVETVNDGHCQAYVEQEDCSCFTFNDTNYYLDYNANNLGGYALTYKYTTETRLNHITNVNGWAGTDGNYARDIKANDCDLLTIGGHFSIADISINSCTIRNHCRAHGWGVFEINDSKHILPDGDVRQMTLGTRYDYGNSWDGVMRIGGTLDVYIGDTTRQYSIVSAQEPKGDHGFIGVCPDIDVNAVNIHTNRITKASGMEIRGIDLGVSTKSNFEKHQRIPSNHKIASVKIVGNRLFNRIDFRPVYNNRDYSLMTAEEFSLIRGDVYIYSLNVSDIDIYQCGSSDSDGYYGIHTFNFPSRISVRQNVTIDNSGNCIPVIKADNNIYVNMLNMESNYLAVDARTNRDFTSSNEVHVTNCTVYQPEVINASGFRPCLIFANNTKFDWLSMSPYSTLRVKSDYDADLGKQLALGRSGVLVMIQGCYGRLAGGSRTYDATFKGYVVNNYRAGSFIV